MTQAKRDEQDMTMPPSVGTRSTYQVTVTNVLGAALRAEFACSRVATIAASTVMQLRVPSDQGPADIARMLSAKGLVILSVRRVHDWRVGPELDDADR